MHLFKMAINVSQSPYSSFLMCKQQCDKLHNQSTFKPGIDASTLLFFFQKIYTKFIPGLSYCNSHSFPLFNSETK